MPVPHLPPQACRLSPTVSAPLKAPCVTLCPICTCPSPGGTHRPAGSAQPYQPLRRFLLLRRLSQQVFTHACTMPALTGLPAQPNLLSPPQSSPGQQGPLPSRIKVVLLGDAVSGRGASGRRLGRGARRAAGRMPHIFSHYPTPLHALSPGPCITCYLPARVSASRAWRCGTCEAPSTQLPAPPSAPPSSATL